MGDGERRHAHFQSLATAQDQPSAAKVQSHGYKAGYNRRQVFRARDASGHDQQDPIGNRAWPENRLRLGMAGHPSADCLCRTVVAIASCARRSGPPTAGGGELGPPLMASGRAVVPWPLATEAMCVVALGVALTLGPSVLMDVEWLERHGKCRWLRSAGPGREKVAYHHARPSMRSLVGAPLVASTPSNRTIETCRRSRRMSRGTPPLECLRLRFTHLGRSATSFEPTRRDRSTSHIPQPRGNRGWSGICALIALVAASSLVPVDIVVPNAIFPPVGSLRFCGVSNAKREPVVATENIPVINPAEGDKIEFGAGQRSTHVLVHSGRRDLPAGRRVFRDQNRVCHLRRSVQVDDAPLDPSPVRIGKTGFPIARTMKVTAAP